MIDFSTLQGLTIPEGAVTQIADASGRVLWSATIKFTINGDTYIADRGMTWAEWFASDYNTTGETEGTITDANGNEVSMDAVIVGGTAYEVGFAPDTVTITITGSSGEGYGSVSIDGTTYWSATTIEVPIGTVVECYVNSDDVYYLASKVIVNGAMVASTALVFQPVYYSYTVTCNTTINISEIYIDYLSPNGYKCDITITET